MSLYDETDRSFYVIGEDLGQTRDYTALSVLRVKPGQSHRASEMMRYWDPDAKGTIIKPSYELVHLERVRGKSYPQIVNGLKEMLAMPQFGGYIGPKPPVVVDATGVGVAVVNMMRDEHIKTIAVTITGGDAVTGKGDDWHVPKRDLVNSLVILFQTQRLVIASGLPMFQDLLAELQNFRVKISDKGHDSYSAWREADHDDLVLSVAIACWYAEKIFSISSDEEDRPEDQVLLAGGGSW